MSGSLSPGRAGQLRRFFAPLRIFGHGGGKGLRSVAGTVSHFPVTFNLKTVPPVFFLFLFPILASCGGFFPRFPPRLRRSVLRLLPFSRICHFFNLPPGDVDFAFPGPFASPVCPTLATFFFVVSLRDWRTRLPPGEFPRTFPLCSYFPGIPLSLPYQLCIPL